jgi:hypothetical protein
MTNSPLGMRMAAFVLLVYTSLPHPAFAHRPVFTDDPGKSPETAIQMTNPDISQVVYREISRDTPYV